jgi:hypothetical protein
LHDAELSVAGLPRVLKVLEVAFNIRRFGSSFVLIHLLHHRNNRILQVIELKVSGSCADLPNPEKEGILLMLLRINPLPSTSIDCPLESITLE